MSGKAAKTVMKRPAIFRLLQNKGLERFAESVGFAAARIETSHESVAEIKVPRAIRVVFRLVSNLVGR